MKQNRLTFVLVILGLMIAAWIGRHFWLRQSQSQRPDPLPQDPFIQVYANQNQAKGADYTEPYRLLERPGDDLEQVVVDAIKTAKSSVDVAVQELRLPKIAQALADRHKVGVKVRVILENTYNRPWSELYPGEVSQLQPRARDRYDEFVALVDRDKNGSLTAEEIKNGDALAILRDAGIPILDDTADGSKGSGLMHHKFVAIDRATVVTGSANFTTSGIHGDFRPTSSRGNANHLLVIKNAPLTQHFTEEFNILWGDGPGGKPNSKFGLKKPFRPAKQLKIGESVVTLQFSPISPTRAWNLSSNGLIGKTLNRATQSVRLALFVFSEQPLANILETKHQQGASISALIDPSFAYPNYSEALDMLGVALSKGCKYEANNHPWSSPISTVGVPQLPPGDKLHHKFGVVDERIVITGSHNWSAAANHTNDETLLVIENPVVAAHFEREFERLYKNAVLGVPTRLQKKIAAQHQNCAELNPN
ncbi:phospholipase D-like domain-containing protein [Lusitaniella coriacea]|uniref:phospholipase D-like domain-containing protein n=1 Tax=Lusitaniella coriacea TaxID=1983105 RepID=UPI003CFAB791